MLVTMKEILDKASKENYAVAAPNVWSELDAKAVIKAAEEMNAPLILDVAHYANDNFIFFGSILKELAKNAKVPVAINLDHGSSKKEIMDAVMAGFTSVMFDCSSLSFEDNVKSVSEVVDIAHLINITVEAELGHVGMAETYNSDDNLTSSDQALEFIKRTNVDCLAVAIGTAHGSYPKGVKPKIDFDRLQEIKRKTNIPLVMHGSSGTDIEDLKLACKLGINKVNISNDLCKAVANAMKSADFEGNNAYKVYDVMYESIKNKLKEMIEIYGSSNKV